MPDSTPMMQQYDRLKSQHSDAILFFRLGDFYEMFKNDAKEASGILGLTLTARNGVPMCGIPYHAVLSYIPKLLNAGKKVAICEQTSIPEKGIADRKVVEVLTPGTVIDASCLDRADHNFIASICRFPGSGADVGEGLCVAFLDVSTGELIVSGGEESLESLRGYLQLYRPRELLLQEGLRNSLLTAELSPATINYLPDWQYEEQNAWETLCRIMNVKNLKAYGFEQDSPYLNSVKALLEYVETNTGKQIRHINSLRMIREQGHLVIDSSSLRNLEIIHSNSGETKGRTLFSVIDHTKTRMGKRLLKQWLSQPLINIRKIQKRQLWVSFLYHDQLMLNKCRGILAALLDLPRLGMRVSMERADPRDLVAVGRTLSGYLQLYELFHDTDLADLFKTEDLGILDQIVRYLSRALVDNPPALLSNGGIIREGFNSDIDHFRHLENAGQQMLQEYLGEERAKSGIQNLRIKHNGIIGYFLEVSKGQSKKIPAHFEKRQGLVNVDRFTTVRLKELAAEIGAALDNLQELEKTIFMDLRGKVQEVLEPLFGAAEILAILDCLQSLAYKATLHGYTCPEFIETELIEIKGGRHPVVETVLDAASFIPNDLLLQPSQFFNLVTGPNMAGKSTYLRQNALIVLLAHIGSFVPADSARMGIVDRIFCRVGASDDLARGESTFLVEMNETAHILRNATSRSLVIMDEVGRGTSTQDGLAIAWAVSEYILEYIKCQTLFATHFHELSELEHKNLKNFSLQVKEADGAIIFLNKVIDGPSNNSYGLYVAQIAGIPDEVLFKAGDILKHIQDDVEISPGTSGANAEKYSFQPRVQKSLFAQDELVIQELAGLNINALTPLEALNYLERMQKTLNS